jgi:membrane fusion protein (multidrug efflux system)
MVKSSSRLARQSDARADDIEETAERSKPVARPATTPPSPPQPLPPERPPGVPERPQAPAAGQQNRDALRRGKGRRSLRAFLMLGGIFAVLVAGGDFWLSGGRYVSTDDSYVQAPKLMVSTDISGIVASVDVHQGQKVAAGDELFRVDPTQFQIALDSAKAQLAEMRLTLEAAEQDYQRLQSDIEAQQAQVGLAQVNYDRANVLVRNDYTSRATYDQARYGLEAAQKTLASLQQQARVALTRLDGNADMPVEQHPQYLQAKAQVDEAQRQLDHTIVRAPFAGIVTEVDALQPGTYLVAQTAALTNTGAIGLMGTDDMWVDANMKETDLTYVKAGDPAEVTVDTYPGQVWRGKVASIYPASGAEFSILPAQNSSGNWVKVVQRITVRVGLMSNADDPPLRAGMSATVSIDTGHKRTLADLWGGGSPAAPATSQDGSHGQPNG